MESAVAAGSTEGAVLWMEGDIVDRVDIGDVALRRVTVTLEGEIAGSVLFFDVLNCAAAFNGTNGKSRCIRKTAHDAGLPLERALQGLVELEGIGEVDDVDVAVCGADDEQVVANIHSVDTFLRSDGANGRRASGIPVLDRLIPRTCHNHGAVGLRGLEKASALDGLVVNGNLLLLAG